MGEVGGLLGGIGARGLAGRTLRRATRLSGRCGRSQPAGGVSVSRGACASPAPHAELCSRPARALPVVRLSGAMSDPIWAPQLAASRFVRATLLSLLSPRRLAHPFHRRRGAPRRAGVDHDRPRAPPCPWTPPRCPCGEGSGSFRRARRCALELAGLATRGAADLCCVLLPRSAMLCQNAIRAQRRASPCGVCAGQEPALRGEAERLPKQPHGR